MKIKAKNKSEGKPNITKSQNITRAGGMLSVGGSSNWTSNLLVFCENVLS